jgi:hypothetical protein
MALEALGRGMLEAATKRLAAKGAKIMTAGFPAQNRFAVAFRRKNGFRALTQSVRERKMMPSNELGSGRRSRGGDGVLAV